MAQALGGLLAALLLGTAGCGIPENTEVSVEGSGPAAEAGATSGGRVEPPTRTASDSPEEFVLNFLSAAAGEPDGAYGRVRQFVDTADRPRLQEKQGSAVALTVVRLIGPPRIVTSPDQSRVTLRVQQVGQLRADGVLEPPEATAPSYEFGLRPTVQESGVETDWYVVDPPAVLLLSVEALARFYTPRPVYFWSSDRSRLVPDQRYLPLAVPKDRQVSEVVRWLTGGPSDWLRKGVSPLPDRTELINNATRTDDRWEVNLNMSGADRSQLDQLGTQLAWSLPELNGQLELKINNQSRLTIDDVAQRRQAYPAYSVDDAPRRFCVYEGAVHSLEYPGEPKGPVPVAATANTNVVSAGFSRYERGILAALVVTSQNGRQHLSVGVGADPVTAFTRSQGFGAMGRPVWLRSASSSAPAGLVVADRKLYRFDAQAKLSQVALGTAGDVTAVAASPDGHRLAMIVGGALYVLAVNHGTGVLDTGSPRRLYTSLTNLSAVDWSGENTLVVAGSAGQPAIYEISVDGARETALQDTGAAVAHLSAYPANPAAQLSGKVMYEANGVAYRGVPFEQIHRDQVQDVTPPPAGVRAGNPTAPFFLY
ncbi:LpqB family beta-propeller domain-containing protein [Micromonospora sp. H33]|uniref:LpqB family beta-propeller domain-containing protein n=1 Tax=Micromonospora sp. H33 TaxID=3452215 RepID=UPI003F8C76D5